MSGALLLTGGTGFLGMELLGRLLDAGDPPEVLVAVRARDRHEADGRLRATLERLYDDIPADAERLRAVRLDLMAPDLELPAAERAELARVERVVHCAASISFTLPLEEARAINVEGTRRILELARDLPRLRRLVHVSTAYVGGSEREALRETDAAGGDFRNTYEQTKAEAEHVVEAADLPSVVVRPSMVVGESDSGWTSAFNVVYWPLQAFARGLLREVPADPSGLVDTVPVDHVADVILRAAYAPEARGRFHAVAGDRALTVGELAQRVSAALGRPAPSFVAPDQQGAEHPAGVLAPYFDVRTRFDDGRARALLRELGPSPDPTAYLPALLRYARATAWGKRAVSRQAARAEGAAPHPGGLDREAAATTRAVG